MTPPNVVIHRKANWPNQITKVVVEGVELHTVRSVKTWHTVDDAPTVQVEFVGSVEYVDEVSA